MKRCEHCGRTMPERVWASIARGYWRWRETRTPKAWTPWRLIAVACVVSVLAYPIDKTITGVGLGISAFLALVVAGNPPEGEHVSWWRRR